VLTNSLEEKYLFRTISNRSCLPQFLLESSEHAFALEPHFEAFRLHGGITHFIFLRLAP